MQIEVFDWLKEQRKLGVEEYFLPHQIVKGMTKDGYFKDKSYYSLISRIATALARLEAYDYVEVKILDVERGGKRGYRVQYKYLLPLKRAIE